MNIDYSYCITAECKKREECKRWLGNYQTAEVEELFRNDYGEFIIDNNCIEHSHYAFEDKRVEDEI